MISKYPLASTIKNTSGTSMNVRTQNVEYRCVDAIPSTHVNTARINAIQKTLPNARMMGAGRLKGNGNTAKRAPTNMMTAISIRSQKFSLIKETPDWKVPFAI
jgi:hypothetical protein